MLSEHQQAAFVLTAITLRGVGSYLHGTRLDIRPLTILCGKNGSGKSTWLKALNLLSRSLEANRLPFGFDDTSPGKLDREFRDSIMADLAEGVADVDAPGPLLAEQNEVDKLTRILQIILRNISRRQETEALSAFYYRADPDDHARLADPEATRQYGPPGTIGLEFTAARDRGCPFCGRPRDMGWACFHGGD